MDATQHQSLAGRYGVQGYPTIKYFPAGTKGDAEEYDGGRTADDIVKWAENRDAVQCRRETHISGVKFCQSGLCDTLALSTRDWPNHLKFCNFQIVVQLMLVLIGL